MQPSVVRAALARLAASAVAVLALCAAPVQAGDIANIQFLGYSEDGRYFAFEEFGIHDGSGGAYSHIYVVDLPADKWTYGSPFSVDEIADAAEGRPLATVRAEALAKAQEKLRPLRIGAPVQIMALIGDGIPDEPGRHLAYSFPICCGPGATDEHRFTLTLETFPATLEADYCAEMSSVGYRLTYDDGTGSRVLHEDGAILPKSRGCTLDYRLYAVVQPFEGPGGQVAIISSYPFGFEGPDRRFLAVPIDQ